MGKQHDERNRSRGAVAVVLVLALAAASAVVGPSGPASADAAIEDPDAYPARGFHDVKGVSGLSSTAAEAPDLAARMGAVSLNLVWSQVQPEQKPAPCGGGEVEYDGFCFVEPTWLDREVGRYTDWGVSVVGITWGTPEWARGSRPCDAFSEWHEAFCVPDDPADFARFVGFMASRYDGASGHGRVADFVIQNEVNLNQWFNIGCGKGIPCSFEEWLDTYADLYNRAYDAIRAHQARAKVMVSLTHHFDQVHDDPEARHPVWSIESFLPPLVERLGDREWSVALHPYPRSVYPDIDARDLPYATLGNLGVVPGWLRARFPDDPHAWEVELTEQGLNNPGLYDDEQAASLCEAFRGVLGTPGIRSFIYHAYRDNPDEYGLALGLRRLDGSPKPAFAIWRDANDPVAPTCGFENDGTTVVRTGVEPSTGRRWVSSRPLPDGYQLQPRQWRLSYEQLPGTHLLYECGRGDGSAPDDPDATYLWPAADCGGDTPLGPVGWIAAAPVAGSTPLTTCVAAAPVVVEGTACATGTPVLLGHAEAEDVPPELLEPEEPEEPEQPEEPEEPEAPEPPGPDPADHDLVLALTEGTFRIGATPPITLPDGEPPSEGRAWLFGGWDQGSGELDVELQVPTFTQMLQTAILPDPIPITLEISQIGGGHGSLDAVTGTGTVHLRVTTRLTSPDPLIATFLGDECELGPIDLDLETTAPFAFADAVPTGVLEAERFAFPPARNCGAGGNLNTTIDAAMGLPTGDTTARLHFELRRAPEVEPPEPPGEEPGPAPTATVPSAPDTSLPVGRPVPLGEGPPAVRPATPVAASPRFTG